MMTFSKVPPLMVRLQVLSAIDYAEGKTQRDRYKTVSQQTFVDQSTGRQYRFTWRTIETWVVRHKKHGMAVLDKKTRSDKNTQRKVTSAQLAEAINEVLPTLSLNKVGKIPKSTLYRCLLEKKYFSRPQLSPTTFYRYLRENDLLNTDTTEKLRTSFAMRYANELWQGDDVQDVQVPRAQEAQERPRCMARAFSRAMANGGRLSLSRLSMMLAV